MSRDDLYFKEGHRDTSQGYPNGYFVSEIENCGILYINKIG